MVVGARRLSLDGGESRSAREGDEGGESNEKDGAEGTTTRDGGALLLARWIELGSGNGGGVLSSSSETVGVA